MLGLGLSQTTRVTQDRAWSPADLFTPGAKGLLIGGCNPAAGLLWQDAAASLRSQQPGDPVGLLRRLAGSTDAGQSTAAARPALGRHPRGGRRNLLTWTEDLANAVWTRLNTTAEGLRVTENAASNVSPIIRRTISLSGAGLAYSLSYRIRTLGSLTGISCLIMTTEGNRTVRLNLSTGEVLTTGAVTATALPEGSGWYRMQLGFTSDAVSYFDWRFLNSWPSSGVGAAYDAGGSNGIELAELQIEVGSTPTPYQRVRTALDVTEARVPECWYLQFDGTDDSLSTAAIAWGSDEVTVLAAADCEAATATGILAEFSANSASNTGTWMLTGPNAASDARPLWRSRGSGSAVDVTASQTMASGQRRLLAARSKIAAPLAALRVDGGMAVQAGTSQGSGQFGSQPVHLGMRAGASLPFKGKLYDLMIINRRLTDEELTRAERHFAQRYGITLA